MANMMATGAAWLADQQQAHASEAVTYRRGTSPGISISATPGLAGRQLDSQTGEMSWHDQLWHIPVSVLTIGEPQRGDRIEWGGEVFEVLPAASGDFFSRDTSNTVYHIQTKRITKA